MTKNSNVPNRLISEKSPYLLQHAYNPVAWFPWCKEAFEKAKAEDKPVFLSIGYSTCHWCHVMEKESFEDEEVAEILNANFIAIKVDKEERPDIDSIYMNVCQAMTGSGGWPLTILMTPDKKPFYAGTYFPKRSSRGMPGLMELLSEINKRWKLEKDDMEKLAHEITSFIKKPQTVKSFEASPEKILRQAFESMSNSFDEEYGGFGNAPKFPMAHGLLFLMKYYRAENVNRALEMSEKTLLQMYKGGIFDHIGFGFSRYSTDDQWLAPHFEKMLYDNALLILAYAEAYKITGIKDYQNIVEKTIQYILKELTSPEGGFYCAQDADSEGVEGKYYLFEPEEVIKILGETDGKHFNETFNITEKGNFEGKSIPNLIFTGIKNQNIEVHLPKLYEYRKKRYALHLDDKILSAWNGLMIGTLSSAYAAFKNPLYLNAAERAAAFIKDHMTENNTVFTSYRDGKISKTSFIDDYAFYIFGLLELYKVTFNNQYAEKAYNLTEKAIEEFYDINNGGFYLYGKSGEQLLTRPKETYDGAIPSGNSVMAYNMLILSKLNKTEKLEKYTEMQFEFMMKESFSYPSSHSFFMTALMLYMNPPKEIVCVLKDKSDFNFVVNQVPEDAIVKILDCKTTEYPLKNNKTTFYICQHHHCLPPVNEL